MPSRFVSWADRVLLASTLHRLVDRELLLLTVFGRRSGRPYTFPVRYVRRGESVTVVAEHADHTTWWLNVVHPAPVRMRIGGRTRKGIAQVEWDAARADRALVTFAKAHPRPEHAIATPARPEGRGGLAVATAEPRLRDQVVVRIDLTVDL